MHIPVTPDQETFSNDLEHALPEVGKGRGIIKQVLHANWTAASRYLIGTTVSKFSRGATFSFHVHEGMDEQFYCVAGRGWLRVIDRQGERKLYPMRPGSCLVVKAGCWHEGGGKSWFSRFTLLSTSVVAEGCESNDHPWQAPID